MKEITIPNGVPERFINATPYALAIAAKFEPNKWKSKVLKQLRKNKIKENEATYGKDHELFGRSIASPSQIRRGIEYYEYKISDFRFEIRQVTSGNIYVIVNKFFDDKEEVKGAGGIFLQALPGADRKRVIEAEQMIQRIDSLGELFARGHSAEQVIHDAFSNLEPKFLDNSRVEFFCRCSKDRMEGYLKNLPEKEKKDMLKKGPFPVEVRCHYCNSVYLFYKDDLRMLGK